MFQAALSLPQTSKADSVTVIQKHAIRPFIRTLPLLALAFVNFALFGKYIIEESVPLQYSACGAGHLWES